jgi:hypothetical protein
MPDRIIDFPQWKKASRTFTNIAMRGVFPFNAICSRRSESLTSDAVPLMRTTSRRFGHLEDSPEVSWPIAEVIFDKYGEPFDAEAAIRQEIINYHKSCE